MIAYFLFIVCGSMFGGLHLFASSYGSEKSKKSLGQTLFTSLASLIAGIPLTIVFWESFLALKFIDSQTISPLFLVGISFLVCVKSEKTMNFLTKKIFKD